MAEKQTTSNTVPFTDPDGVVSYKAITDRIQEFSKELSTSQSINSPINNNVKTKSITNKSEPLEIIDVIKDYDWTYSSKSLLKNSEIPYVYLKEFKILGNSYMSSLMTSALLYPDIAKSALDADSPVANLFEKIKTSYKDNKFGKFMSEMGNRYPDLVDKLEDNTKKATDWVKSQMESIDKTANAWGANKQDLIDNYSYLYLRKPTNTEYKIPYFENNFFNIRNSFQDSYDSGNKWVKGLFGEFEGIIKDVAEAASAPVALSEPGMYIQRPKFYDFSDDGYEITLKFYLFNTLNENSYLQNLNLLTKLILQNTPHRHNRLLVDPACIYELTVPGRGFYPYTYISTLNVNHLGTKRILKGEMGNDIIVPDAFEIDITLKSLTSEVNNFIIPETGTSGINVSQRYGLGNIIKGTMDNSTSKQDQIPSQNKLENPNNPTINQSVSMSAPSNVGRTSQPVRIAMGG